MNEQELKLIENIGVCKARSIRRLCKIMDHKDEKYNVEELLQKTREEINDMIIDSIEQPYQRFDS